jgi:hypothetical protein
VVVLLRRKENISSLGNEFFEMDLFHKLSLKFYYFPVICRRLLLSQFAIENPFLNQDQFLSMMR